jgi:outer membrane protein assembly factor BamB
MLELRAWLAALLLGLAAVAIPSTADASAERGQVTSFDARNGDRNWAISAPKEGGGFDLLAATKTAVFGVLNRCLWDDNPRYRAGDTTLIAWDARNGRELWRVPDVGSGIESLTEPPGGTVALLPGVEPRDAIPVYTRSRGELRGLSTKDGTTLWRLETGDSEVVAGDATDLLLSRPPYAAVLSNIPRSPAAVTLVDSRSGMQQWSTTLDADTVADFSAVLPAQVALLLTTTPTTLATPTQRIEMRDRTTGSLLWARAPDSYALPEVPDVMPGTSLRYLAGALLLTHSGTTISIDPVTGNELWRLSGALNPTGSATTAGAPTLFARPPSNNGPPTSGQVALDARTGKVRWTGPIDKLLLAPGGNVVAEMPASLDHQEGTGSIVDARTGAHRWSTMLGDDDSLVARTGTLYRGTGCPTTLRD